MTLVNLILVLIIAGTTNSLLSVPEKLNIKGEPDAVERWFRVHALRSVLAFVVASTCCIALVVLNVRFA